MGEAEATDALKAAGADRVELMTSFGFVHGIKVSVGERENAVQWRDDHDLTGSAVFALKEWLERQRAAG